jgi:hypothetical protein
MTKPNIDSNNYVGQLSRPRPSTCNSFHFHSLEVEFLESRRSERNAAARRMGQNQCTTNILRLAISSRVF